MGRIHIWIRPNYGDALGTMIFPKMRAMWWYGVGLSYRFYGVRTGNRQHFEQSDDAFCRALVYLPLFHKARFQRGLLYWRELHHPARAIKDFSYVLKATNDFPDALFMRAMAYQEIGDYQNATIDLQLFIGIYPNSRWADNAQRQLRLLQGILNELRPRLGLGDDTSHLTDQSPTIND